MKVSRTIWWNIYNYLAIKIIEKSQESSVKNLKINLRTHFKFSNLYINKFILLLRKGAYPYEYMDDWERFNEITLPEKEEFHSNLNMEEITHADYMHGKSL